MAAGTVVVYNSGFNIGTATGTPPSLANSGDQFFAYTGLIADAGGTATYLAAANWANSGWITSGAGSSNASYLPSALATGAQNLAIGNQDNYVYSWTLSGTPDALLTALNTPSNWTSDNSTPFTWTAGSFTVIPEPSTLCLGAIGMLTLFARRRAAR